MLSGNSLDACYFSYYSLHNFNEIRKNNYSPSRSVTNLGKLFKHLPLNALSVLLGHLAETRMSQFVLLAVWVCLKISIRHGTQAYALCIFEAQGYVFSVSALLSNDDDKRCFSVSHTDVANANIALGQDARM